MVIQKYSAADGLILLRNAGTGEEMEELSSLCGKLEDVAKSELEVGGDEKSSQAYRLC